MQEKRRRRMPAPPYSRRFRLLVVEEEDSAGDGSGPAAVLVPNRRLGYVGGANDFVGDAIDLFFLVPALVGVEVEVERGGQHLGGKLFRVVAGLFLGLAEAEIGRASCRERGEISLGG